VHDRKLSCRRETARCSNYLVMRQKPTKSCPCHLKHALPLYILRHTVSQEIRQRLVSALILSRIRLLQRHIRWSCWHHYVESWTRPCRSGSSWPRNSRLERFTLDWLLIEQRITYKLCIMMHAVNNGTILTLTLCDLATPINEIRISSAVGYTRSDISTCWEPEQGLDRGISWLLVPLHGTVFL